MVVEIMKGITKAAKQANGRSQACATCPLNRSRGVCLPEIQRVCSDAFIEGFKKGVKLIRKESNDNSMVFLRCNIRSSL